MSARNEKLARNTLRLRAARHRGVDGWVIGGRRAGDIRSVSIFFEHQGAAERTIKRMREDPRYDVTVADFEPEAIDEAREDALIAEGVRAMMIRANIDSHVE